MLSFVCYVCAILQNSALFITISENTDAKKTLENNEVYGDKEVWILTYH